jgi:hypothetical protein
MRPPLRHFTAVVVAIVLGVPTPSARAQATADRELGVSAGAAVGWTRASYDGSNGRVTLSGPALDLRFAVGHRTAEHELMLCGGVLLAPHLESSAALSPTDRLWLPHLGACASVRAVTGGALMLGARLELAEAVVSGPSYLSDSPPPEGILTAATGGVLALSASYAPPLAGAHGFAFGFELQGGYFRRHEKDLEPVTGLLFGEARWP